ncbi:MAG: putative transporter [Bacteroidales bacterium]|nr:putative transporter [Bacteroidales bacterium]
MDWIKELFFGDSIAHTILIFAAVISVGLFCNKIKFGKIALGNTWILFAGLAAAHFGFTVNAESAEFIKNFGLVLFVYCIGLQVGPSFFSSFREGGVKLNLLAMLMVVLGSALAIGIAAVSGESISDMVGVLAGAVTNTPSLGAAQQVLSEVNPDAIGSMAMGYAVAYPMGVVGVILVFIIVKNLFKINLEHEQESASASAHDGAERLNVKVTNPAIFGQGCEYVTSLAKCRFVVARIMRGDRHISAVSQNTVLEQGDILRIICKADDFSYLVSFFGEQVHIPSNVWESTLGQLVTKRVLISKPEINGKSLADLKLRHSYDVNVTRVTRAGVDIVPSANFILQMGDRVTVVGRENDCQKVSDLLGNSMKKLDVPHILPIFVGIFLGIILGSIPIYLPNMPYPVKLGLAGGPLIVAILMGRYGPRYKMVTFTTTSANLMLREVGISLFLAAVGLLAGEHFVETVVSGGYVWILWGCLITMLPALVLALVMRLWLKQDYFTILGTIAGGACNPIALSYANSLSSSQRCNIAYTTVYPLTMFLRILVAEVIIMVSVL